MSFDLAQESYAGYHIVVKGRRACVGVNEDGVEKYVCWLYDFDGKGVNTGFYSNSYREALKKFLAREER